MSVSRSLSRGVAACIMAGVTLVFAGAAQVQTEEDKIAAFVKDRRTQSLDGEGRVFYDGERRILTSYDCTLNTDARASGSVQDFEKNPLPLYGCGYTTVDFKNDLVTIYNFARQPVVQHPVNEIYHMSGLASDLKIAKDALCLSIELPKIPDRKASGHEHHKHH